MLFEEETENTAGSYLQVFTVPNIQLIKALKSTN